MEFDMTVLTELGLGLGAISIGLIAVMMLGGAFWPEQAQRYKKLINEVIIGAVLLLVGSSIITMLANSF